MSAYLIYDVDIHDPAPYGEFMEKIKPLVKSFGGKYLVRGGAHEVLEGEWRPSRAQANIAMTASGTIGM
jgi:uncharacterized protein (DUF1330 family)